MGKSHRVPGCRLHRPVVPPMIGASVETWLPVAPPKASTVTGALAVDGAASTPPSLPAPRSASVVAPDIPVPDRRTWTGPGPRLAVQTVDPRLCDVGAGQSQASERGAGVAEAATGLAAILEGTMPSSTQAPPMTITITSAKVSSARRISDAPGESEGEGRPLPGPVGWVPRRAAGSSGPARGDARP